MKARIAALALVFMFVGAALPADAGTYAGVASAPGVVWVSGDVPAPVTDAAIRQTSKTFVPALLVVPAGSSVRFPNDDQFYHSVYSTSPSNPFDLGLYDNGPGKTVEFDNPGIVDVRCHVHGSMHATIVVVDGPYAVTVKANQRYRIAGLRPGPHTVHTWTEGGATATTSIVVK